MPTSEMKTVAKHLKRAQADLKSGNSYHRLAWLDRAFDMTPGKTYGANWPRRYLGCYQLKAESFAGAGALAMSKPSWRRHLKGKKQRGPIQDVLIAMPDNVTCPLAQTVLYLHEAGHVMHGHSNEEERAAKWLQESEARKYAIDTLTLALGKRAASDIYRAVMIAEGRCLCRRTPKETLGIVKALLKCEYPELQQVGQRLGEHLVRRLNKRKRLILISELGKVERRHTRQLHILLSFLARTQPKTMRLQEAAG